MPVLPRLIQLACLATVVAIFPASAVVLGTEDLDAFGKKAAAALDSVGRFDERVALDWEGPGSKSGFAFYGKGPRGFEKVECEEVQEFHIIAHAVAQAQFRVGACKREAARVRDLAAVAGKETAAFLEETAKDAKPADHTKREKRFASQTVALGGGMTGYAFTVILVGHGVILMNSAVVYDRSRQIAFVVQADVAHLCGHNAPDGKPAIPNAFCPETNKAFLEAAADLAKRYSAPK